MWVVLFIVGVVLCVAAYLRYFCNQESTLFVYVGSILGIFLILIGSVSTLAILTDIHKLEATTSKQIAILEERNTSISEAIESIISKYENYESSILKDCKVNVDTLSLIGSLYPTLQSNNLYQSQISILQENEKTITKLKLER